MRADGVIFDLDGTLWDACAAVAESWRMTIERCGRGFVPTAEDTRSIMGLTREGVARKLFRSFGGEADRICGLCLDEECENMRGLEVLIFSGTEQMLRDLSARLPLYIVSNCQDGYIERFFESSGFAHFFSDYECEGSTGLDKAGNLRLIIKRHGLKSPVYIGDTEGDERSARAAGCAFIHAAYGFGRAESPDAAADGPEQIAGLILS